MSEHHERSAVEALKGAADDIRARRREFVRLGADEQYLQALDDAWGLVSNRRRDAEIGARERTEP